MAVTRHFFIPRSCMIGGGGSGEPTGEAGGMLVRLVPSGRSNSVVVAHRDEMLVFWGFLELEEGTT